jgi:hypothetical protein
MNNADISQRSRISCSELHPRHKYFWYVDLLRLAFYLAAANAILFVELCWLFLVPISNKAVSPDSQAISYVDDVYNQIWPQYLDLQG